MAKSNAKSQRARVPKSQSGRKNKGSTKAGNRKRPADFDSDADGSDAGTMEPCPRKKRRGGKETSEEIVEVDDDEAEEVEDDEEEPEVEVVEKVSH